MLCSLIRVVTRILIFIGVFFEPLSVSVETILNILHEQKFAEGGHFST